MEMKPVESSSIKAIGHDGDTMHVTFKNGATYVYEGVKAHVFDGLHSAKSIGKHFAGMKMKGTKLAEKKKNGSR